MVPFVLTAPPNTVSDRSGPTSGKGPPGLTRMYPSAMAPAHRPPSIADSVEFDLHGRVGIRLVDPRPRDVAAVERQLGPLRGRLDREPDIVIRFVGRLPIHGTLRYLGDRDVGFTDDSYVILRGRFQADVRVAIPIDQLGGPCEIVCEHGVPAVPSLIQILVLTALWNGFIPLHACAFIHADKGVLVTGWAKGGKSETLLAFGARGATYVGDEWVFLDPTDGRMYGLPEPMRVWDWQLASMPAIKQRVPRSDRARLIATRAVVRGAGMTAAAPVVGGSAVGRLARRGGALLANQLSVQVPPEQLLPGTAFAGSARLDHALLVMSHRSDTIDIETIDPELLAERATESFAFELTDLLAHRRRFRFAFGDRPMPFLDGFEERHRAALRAAVAGVPALSVSHPYPLEIPRLYDALADRLT